MHGIDGMDLNQDKITEQSPLHILTTEKIIGCAFSVMNTLGSGFLEKVYENAMAVELRRAGLNVIEQKPIEIRCHDILVGEYVVDLLVENNVLVELKAVRELEDVFYAQCLNYLKATGFGVCSLLNFGK